MKTPCRAGVAFAFCACVAGCAATGTSSFTTITARNAAEAITIGKSTKADVIAALGKTMVISFDSGFEVWAYQYKGNTPASWAGGRSGKNEFVVLFAPSGIVTKTRSRPAPPLGASGSVALPLN